MSGEKIIDGLKDALAVARGVKDPAFVRGPAYYTYDYEAEAWYLAMTTRAPGPYLRQIHVEAIIDVDADGNFAGVEIIDERCPKPAPVTIGQCVASAEKESEL